MKHLKAVFALEGGKRSALHFYCFTPIEEPQLPIEQEILWIPEPVWTHQMRKICYSCRVESDS